MKIFVTDQDGKEHELEGIEGWRVMEIIKDYGLPIKAECGGCCACATCHVYVDPAWVPKLYPMRDDEQEALDLAFGVEDNSRLSCQILMSEELDGLKVTLAPGSEP
ncbi:MAG: ferredoxin [Micavibrio aeruginosavorus]|uniref:Ferredoxin n=1 Tax=Micavibrio aeruginosavorus TaxID=349221 RepID=A0A2W5PUU0_9BACT|nr:MAG: ferredoxin [Micavibrio aeruginosavorus]